MARKVLRVLHAAMAMGVTVALAACSNGPTAQTITVSLTNTAIFQYPTAAGENDQVNITKQASHFSLSEVQEESTGLKTYVYKAAAGYVGTDTVDIEIVAGSVGGTGPSSEIQRVTFVFTIHQ